jgi:hypothetical protein
MLNAGMSCLTTISVSRRFEGWAIVNYKTFHSSATSTPGLIACAWLTLALLTISTGLQRGVLTIQQELLHACHKYSKYSQGSRYHY